MTRFIKRFAILVENCFLTRISMLFIASEVLEHLRSPYNGLEKVAEHLTKGGFLLAANPSVAPGNIGFNCCGAGFLGMPRLTLNSGGVDSFMVLIAGYGYLVLSFHPVRSVLPRYLGKTFFVRPRFLHRLFGHQFLFITGEASQT
jgi:hypothetical protein